MPRLEALYELAFLQVFSAWERCQEEVFIRSLCGYASHAGQQTLVNPGYYASIAAARAALLPPGAFWLWHNPDKVLTRCQGYIVAGIQAAVIDSSKSRLEEWGAIRHRIAHDHQEDAKNKFDQAIMDISGLAYIAPRAGRFLRDANNLGDRWIEVAITELVGLASQLV